jgi:hypothetical protein
MRKNFTLRWIILLFSFVELGSAAMAQCPGGYSAAELNWDNIDYLPSNNTRYLSYYPNNAFPYIQNFAIGTRRLNITVAPTGNITLNGENNLHTGDAGSLAAAGDDVQYTTTSAANTTITMTLDANVANLAFSIFDLDANQRVNIRAYNLANVAQNVSIARGNGGSPINITGSGSTNATATGPATSYANTDNRGTINVTSAGPVNRIVLTFSNATGDFWLSDIDACVTGSFPTGYQAISRPFTGQRQYVLTVVNNNVYYVDPATGASYFLFNEPGHNRLNSMAYDPYERIVYYTYSLGPDPDSDKTLKKYDVDTKTISVVLANVNSIGIPTYESGVESGAATFYNGSLYLGIEGYTTASYAAARKSTIWKIDFNAAGNAISPATQVWGTQADNGTNSQNIHDWSDFGISNGMLFDFDGSGSGDYDYFQFNMMTGVTTNYIPTGGVVPRQVSIGWDEKIYNVDDDIGLYNGTTAIGTRYTMFAPLGPTIPTGSSASWGDAAGPYRPFLDFGDAPATYDPDPLSPACHDTLTPNVGGQRTRMRLGPNEDVEWLKRGFTTTEDNFEDGLLFVPIFSPVSSSYLAQVTTVNNSGLPATLCAWLDFNGNGTFDAAEAITPITVPSMAGVQTFNLAWPSISSPLNSGSFTYLRIRITAQSFGMNQNHSTGYYDMGEVEDYQVIVDNFPLPVTLISFDANSVNNEKVKLAWSANEEPGFDRYEIERSQNGTSWERVNIVQASVAGGLQSYELMDHSPFIGASQYRIKMVDGNTAAKFSQVRTVRISNDETGISLYPNPAREKINVYFKGNARGGTASIRVLNSAGATLISETAKLSTGDNIVAIDLPGTIAPGVYIVYVQKGDEVFSEKLIVN